MIGDVFEKYECFGIEVSIVGSEFDFAGRKTIRRQDAGSPLDIRDPKVINADPFLFAHNGRLYLFYEETTFRKPGGRIMMVSTDDLKNWTRPVRISKEDDLHFSFPYVFEDDGAVYMIPETGWGGEVRLYKAAGDDLADFRQDSVLLRRETKDDGIIFDFADNVLYKKDGTYYLFTSILDSEGYRLLLYASSALRGPYRLHPSSPICHSMKFGRNAGALIEADGRLFRPTQDCSEKYGGQVNIMEITDLSPERYRETLLKEHVLPSSDSFYKDGGHQLNYAKFLGKTVMATDARRDRPFFGIRIADKLKRIIGLKNN